MPRTFSHLSSLYFGDMLLLAAIKKKKDMKVERNSGKRKEVNGRGTKGSWMWSRYLLYICENATVNHVTMIIHISLMSMSKQIHTYTWSYSCIILYEWKLCSDNEVIGSGRRSNCSLFSQLSSCLGKGWNYKHLACPTSSWNSWIYNFYSPYTKLIPHLLKQYLYFY